MYECNVMYFYVFFFIFGLPWPSKRLRNFLAYALLVLCKQYLLRNKGTLALTRQYQNPVLATSGQLFTSFLLPFAGCSW